MSFAVCFRGSSRRPVRKILAPSSAKRRAMERPRPVPPPVMKIVRPFSRLGWYMGSLRSFAAPFFTYPHIHRKAILRDRRHFADGAGFCCGQRGRLLEPPLLYGRYLVTGVRNSFGNGLSVVSSCHIMVTTHQRVPSL